MSDSNKNHTSYQSVGSTLTTINSKNVEEILQAKKKANSFLVAELHEAKHISVEAIRMLCSSDFDSLELPNFNCSGTSTLLYFANSNKGLTLGLTKLTPKSAYILSKNTAAIDFDHLTKISAVVAEILSEFKCNVLGLHALKSISINALEKLVKYRGNYLSLCGLKSINIKQATLLSKYRGALFLDGVKSLTPSVASVLLKQPEKFISLKGLQNINDKLLNVVIASKKEVIFKNTQLTNIQKKQIKGIKSVVIF